MSDYISREAASADEYKHKIKTPFAKIIVGGTPEKPCYDILYFDPTDGKCHIGFGSYRLDYVFRWLAEEFEVTEPAADVEPVQHGRWNPGDPICPICGEDKFKGLDADIWSDWTPACCPNCGAKMDLEDCNGKV